MSPTFGETRTLDLAIQCRPILLIYEDEVIGESSPLFPKTTRTIEMLKEEGQQLIAIFFATNYKDPRDSAKAETKPLREWLRILPRELTHISWTIRSGEREDLVVHLSLQMVDLKEICHLLDRYGFNYITEGCEGLADTVGIDTLLTS